MWLSRLRECEKIGGNNIRGRFLFVEILLLIIERKMSIRINISVDKIFVDKD